MRKFLRRFFVSSTFKDFQIERDLLSKEILPDFRKKAREHGEETTIVDLRWGLDNFGLSEKDVVSKVLSVCLGEIDQSRPFMIIFLGDRFGWVPERNLITEKFASKFDSVENESVTALEIKYGVEQLKEPRCIICFREIPEESIPEEFRADYIETDSTSRKKLRELKERLRKNYSDKIIRYTAEIDAQNGKPKNFLTKDGKIPLSEAILLKVLKDCSEDWREYEKLSWQRRELDAANNFVTSRANLFVGREELVEKIKFKLMKAQAVFLKGISGSGKTSIACKIAADFRKIGYPVCFITCGNSPQNSDAQAILQQIIYFLREDVLKLSDQFSPPKDYDGWKKYLVTLCKNIPEEEQLYFFVDSVDKLPTTDKRNLDFLPVFYKNVHCLLTCTDFEIPKNFFNPAEFLDNNFKNLDDDELYNFLLEMTNTTETEFESRIRESSASVEKFFFEDLLTDKELQEIISTEEFKKNFVEFFRESPNQLAEMAPFTFLTEEIPELEFDEREPVLSAMLARVGKTLYTETAVEVLKKGSSGNPLYLEMAAQLLDMTDASELTGMQNSQDIVPLTVRKVANMPNKPSEAASHIICEAKERLSFNGDKVLEAINLLAVSPHGLRLSDLQELLKDESNPKNGLNPLDWALIQKYLHNFFTERQNGQITLSHNIIREGILKKIDAENFIYFEKLLAEHVKKLPVGDFLRAQCAYHYAQRTNDYNFAAELYAEAYKEKNPLLLFNIRETIRLDKGNFIIYFLQNCLSDKLNIESISFFFDDFNIMMFGGSENELEIARDIYKELSKQFVQAKEKFGALYARIKMFEALYETRLGNIEGGEGAKAIYEEIVQWGEENSEKLSKHLDSCRLLSTCYDMLAEFERKSGDINNKAQIYAQKNVEWAEKVAKLDETFVADKYAVLNLVKKLYAKMPESSLEKSLKDCQHVYSFCKEMFQRNSNDPFYLYMTARICTPLINALSVNNLNEALIVAEEARNYVQLLLQTDANNSEYVKIVASLLAEISKVEFKANEFESASENSFEALRLLNMIYLQNPSKENLKLLQDISLELMEMVYTTFQEIL